MVDKSSVVFGAVMTLIGIGIMIAGSVFISQGISTSSWPTTEGTIVVSIGNPSKENPEEIEDIEIRYKYGVENSQFTGTRINSYLDDPTPYRQILDRYREGQKVKVYYNPENPETALLVPGVIWIDFMLPAGGLLFGLIGAGLALFELKKMKQDISLASKINKTRKKYRKDSQYRENILCNEEFSYLKNKVNMSGAVLVIILGLFIIVFPTTIIITVGSPEDMAAIPIVAAITGLIGIILILTVLNVRFSRVRISFNGESVEYEKRSLFRRVLIQENIQNYVFIIPRKVITYHQFKSKKNHESILYICAVLIHRENSKKDIEVRLETRPYKKLYGKDDVNGKVEKFAGRISMPIEEITAG